MNIKARTVQRSQDWTWLFLEQTELWDIVRTFRYEVHLIGTDEYGNVTNEVIHKDFTVKVSDHKVALGILL